MTPEKIKASLGSQAVLLLNNVTDEQLEEMIENNKDIAQSYMDDQINWDAPGKIMEKIVLDFTKFDVFQQEARNDVPEIIQKQYDNSFKLLAKIQKGEIRVGVILPDESELYFTVKDKYFGKMI